MIKSLLIANRGEIAVRIIRTCRDLGIAAVAVYSEADRDSLHVRLADRAVCVGPSPARASYLRRENLVSAAVICECDALHPGVGFLAENAAFARMVAASGLIWIGPSPEVIELLGDKIRAKETAASLGIAGIPGAEIDPADPAGAEKAAGELGYPVILKAASGGGGKGMRIVGKEGELPALLPLAVAEAEAAFGDGTVYLEKYFTNPRHVEVQLLALPGGETAVLGERDCTVQFSHQKLIEESPSPGIGDKLRGKMYRTAEKLFREIGYSGAGTVEFLVAGGECFFMEVNARLQVEHPVTEMLTGVDLVRQQIIAAGENRLETSGVIAPRVGYALECRINAAGPGTVKQFIAPGGLGVRIDTHLFPGAKVSPHYDPLLAKIIVSGRDRPEGIARMRRALAELVIEGVETNLDLQKEIVAGKVFGRGDFGTATFDSLLREDKQ
jgi:acetyl-CoA carboxylase, biotin carboxylase subunit